MQGTIRAPMFVRVALLGPTGRRRRTKGEDSRQPQQCRPQVKEEPDALIQLNVGLVEITLPVSVLLRASS